ncbi:3-phosphoserine/phosphohydroxythreonine transaminase [Legionella fallonii]|uniref:Phosphoserine aminotransferase n=1 Tax=Legionella fallonii LLAP-10 TaxID=1212491 RepID=A0A098GA46_9GAMM|nr:3-phosphoserine/phosphohydroxythreonine transaminase [Legionella fallonii]CEG58885.1 Phosphoserine aminotransferase [Legionella fallonii LLAP-10]
MRKRPINFNAGPAAIPEVVLKTIGNELLNWHDTGVSILELGHRTTEFSALGEKLEASVRRILKVPDEFGVLFLPGGAQVQFAMATMNLVRGFSHANYVETGYWSTMAINEARKYIDVHLAASGAKQNFTTIPEVSTWDIQQNAAFLHFTDNETIGGVEFPFVPEIDGMVLVSDMSSNIFSRAIDFSRLGCIYACAQKNLGIAGMSLVMVRRDLFDRALPETPVVFHYATQDKNHSLAATPPTFAFYVASLILDWLEDKGGVAVMATRSEQKSQLLYQYIDESNVYHNAVMPQYRSRLNVPFTLTDSEQEPSFFKAAEQQGLLYLQGHRSVGGARASLYNAISLHDVKRLIEFLRFFAAP